MTRRWILLSLLCACIPLNAGAITTVEPIGGPVPVALVVGNETFIDIVLRTGDQVGAVSVEFLIPIPGSLTINTCANPGATPGFSCTPIPNGVRVQASDLVGLLGDEMDLVTLSVVANSSVGALNLGVFPTTHWVDCSGPCTPLGPTQPLTNQAAPIALVTPEPASAALLGSGLLGLGWLGRRRRR